MEKNSLSKQCDVNDFIEKNREDAILWKAKFCRKKQRIELESLEPLREELDKNIVELKYRLN
jgi:hypothetical protein